MNEHLPSQAPRSLLEVFQQFPDHRKKRGRRHPLAAILTLAATAILCGCRGLSAIAQWGRDHKDLAPLFGFTRPLPPCTSNLHYVFAALDVTRLEAALTEWLTAREGKPTPRAPTAIDGKTLRGSREGAIPGVHLLAAYAPQVGSALAQLEVERTTNEHKAALQLLGLIPREGRLITGDAAFTQKDVCAAIVAGKGAYFVTVKDNQPALKADIEAAFTPPFSPLGAAALAGGGAGGADRRQRARPRGDAAAAGDEPAEGVSGVAGRRAGLPDRADAPRGGPGEPADGVCPHQPERGGGAGGGAAADRAGALGDRERSTLGA